MTPKILNKIRVPIWSILLFCPIILIVLIMYGALVRYEVLSEKNRFPVISKTAVFLSELPSNIKNIFQNDLEAIEQRFQSLSGFQGQPMMDEAYLLLSKYDGNRNQSIVELIDLKSFEVLKEWSPDFKQLNQAVDTSIPEFENYLEVHNPLRHQIMHPLLTEDGGLIFHGNFTPLFKVDKNSQLVWHNQKDAFHHSLEFDHEGNIWTGSEMFPFQVNSQYVGSSLGSFRDGAITKVSIDGEILFHKSISNIFIENNMGYLIFPILGFRTNDPLHLNDIEPVLSDGPYWKSGDVFLSLWGPSMVILYRPSTNQIISTIKGQMVGQHDVDILDDHRISIFNNNLNLFNNGDVDDHNEILIYDFKTNSYSKYLNSALKENDVRTKTEGRSEILENGDLFFEEQNSGRLLYFNKDSSLQWQFINRANNGNLYVVKWSRILYKKDDISKVKNLIIKDKL